MSAEHDAIEREAKRLFFVDHHNVLDDEDDPFLGMMWRAMDESERTQYRLDAVAALKATSVREAARHEALERLEGYKTSLSDMTMAERQQIADECVDETVGKPGD